MRDKVVLHCPNGNIHVAKDGLGNIPQNKSPNKILLIIDEDCLYTYCHDSKCMKDRGNTWYKICMTKCGKPLNFKNIAISIKEMPKGFNFNLQKIPVFTELHNA